MRLDEQSILDLCRLRDPHGVLSVYVGAPPEQHTSAQPAWAVDIKNQLATLRTRVKDEGPRERWVALFARLDAISDDLDQLLDPRAPGRGRALFAPVSDGEVRRIRLQVPLPDRVVLDDVPYVRPLVAALDEGRPTGVVAADGSGVRLLEWRLGEAEDLVHYTFEEATGDWRELKGPAASNPALAQQTVSHRERFERRLDDKRARFYRSVAGRISRAMRERGWDRMVVLRGAHTELEEALAASADVDLIAVEGHAGRTPAHELAQTVAAVVSGAQRRREIELVELAKDRAASGGQGVVGLADVLTTLAEGRVAHLLFDSDEEFSGFRTSDGRLLAEGQGSDVPDDELVSEPNLVERLVERAIDTGAKVTPVEDEAARALDAVGGVAALLRW